MTHLLLRRLLRVQSGLSIWCAVRTAHRHAVRARKDAGQAAAESKRICPAHLRDGCHKRTCAAAGHAYSAAIGAALHSLDAQHAALRTLPSESEPLLHLADALHENALHLARIRASVRQTSIAAGRARAYAHYVTRGTPPPPPPAEGESLMGIGGGLRL